MKTLTLSLLLLLGTTVSASTVKATKGTVTFLAKGNPGFMKIEGVSGKTGPVGNLESEDGKLSGKLTFNLADLTTGMDLRDEHMREKYLEVKKHPTAKLVLKPLDLRMTEDASGKFTGDLLLHGVTKEVNGTYSYTAGTKTVKAVFPLKVSDFAIGVPSWMGVTVADTVEVTVATELQ